MRCGSLHDLTGLWEVFVTCPMRLRMSKMLVKYPVVLSSTLWEGGADLSHAFIMQSSSQFHCTDVCCVPGPWDGKSPIVPLQPGESCECHCLPTENENMAHLSMIGVLFTICFTYSGFACLVVCISRIVNVARRPPSLSYNALSVYLS